MPKVILFFLVTVIIELISCKDNPIQPVIDPNDPIANAGGNQTINIGSYFVLDGSKSTRGNGNTLIYKWEADPKNPESVFLFGDPIYYKTVTTEGIYKYILVVNNGIKDSKPAELVIKINPRASSIIEDPNLEAQVRFKLNKQLGELSDNDLLNIDSLRVGEQLAYNEKITTIKGIDKCKNLRILMLSIQSITDISPLSNLIKLEQLDIDQNRTLANIEPLANLTQLKHLDISANKIQDINCLSKLTNLNYINIQLNLITDISVITNFKKLMEFWGVDLPIADLSVFSDLKELQLLFLPFSKINDISALTNNTNLRQIEISGNDISDISPFINSKEMFTLRITDNNITDISVLEHLEKLTDIRLSRNKIEDIEPLVKNKGIGEGVIIELIGNPLNEKSLNEYIPQLVARGAIIYR